MATAFRQGEDGHATGAMSTAGRDGYAWWSGLAFVLMGAAALKAHQVATEPYLGTSPFHSRPFLIGAIWLEVLLGIWMLAGLHRRLTRWVVVVCFGAFAVVALSLALGGEESCGCFGQVHVNPGYTSVFDAAIALSVWLFPGSPSPSPTVFSVPGRLIGATAVSLVLAGTLTAVVAGSRPSTLDGAGLIHDHGSPIMLRPETWIGTTFPLLRYIKFASPASEITEGKRLIVPYQHDCSHCQEEVPKTVRWVKNASRTRVAFVELPPFGIPGQSLITRSPRGHARVLTGCLSGSCKLPHLSNWRIG